MQRVERGSSAMGASASEHGGELTRRDIVLRNVPHLKLLLLTCSLPASFVDTVPMDVGTEPVVVTAAPSPKSPPKYPDLCGRRRLQLEVQILNREIGFLEEELQALEGLQPVSGCCKEVEEFLGSNPDPLVPINEKQQSSCRFWKWLRSAFRYPFVLLSCSSRILKKALCCCCCCSSCCCSPRITAAALTQGMLPLQPPLPLLPASLLHHQAPMSPMRVQLGALLLPLLQHILLQFLFLFPSKLQHSSLLHLYFWVQQLCCCPLKTSCCSIPQCPAGLCYMLALEMVLLLLLQTTAVLLLPRNLLHRAETNLPKLLLQLHLVLFEMCRGTAMPMFWQDLMHLWLSLLRRIHLLLPLISYASVVYSCVTALLLDRKVRWIEHSNNV
ncbi:hypothetical protein HPP92_003947 [Vanilla planifolia]|uniref:G protein gamma domain-containing protein n=1 Tax=Vanilla planifolia TaxID=51239 RepID=A0A835VNR5_VANPL|nr:hypothetical protein HPP92_003947 [Vanilla planifolia]